MVILGAAELGVTRPSGPVGCGGGVVGIVEVGVEDCVLEADLYSKPGGGGQSLPPVNRGYTRGYIGEYRRYIESKHREPDDWWQLRIPAPEAAVAAKAPGFENTQHGGGDCTVNLHTDRTCECMSICTYT